MQVLIVSATQKEAAPLADWLKEDHAISRTKHISFCYTGVGIMNTTYHLTDLFNHHRYDAAIQLGIAGCFDGSEELAKTFLIKEDMPADMGAMEETFKDVFDLKLADKDLHPFIDKMLVNPNERFFDLLSLDKASSVTVNKVSTGNDINVISEKYHPLLESMEGAAFHYVCLMKNIPFLQIRSASNYVGERDKSKWNMGEAIMNVNKAAYDLINKL